MNIRFTAQIFKEGRTFVAHNSELNVSSCGSTKESAMKNLREAVRLFIETAEKMGTLRMILAEAGFTKRKTEIEGPKFISMRQVSMALN